MSRAPVLAASCVVLLAACATFAPVDQRTTQGPTADQLWLFRMMAQNGREPTFDERVQWENALEGRINDYLNRNPGAASALDVSTFRFLRRVTVGMTKEQVMILLGSPAVLTTDTGEMEKLARRHWPEIKGNATEAWVYPLGWRFYFAGPRLVDITQHLHP